jgi:hypothetical protein
MRAFYAFWHMDTQSFHAINDALLTLVPKTTEATTLKDYWLISLIHIIGKLFFNVLANRLVPILDSLVHPAQSAFIKGQFIQDNFRYF